MRIRVLGQNLPSSTAILAVLEAGLFFLVLIGAGLVRFDLNLHAADLYEGSLWPRGMLFSALMFTSLFAFGLAMRRRSDRQYFTVVGFVPCESEAILVSRESLLDPAEGLQKLCERLEVDEIVVAMDDRRRDFPVRELLTCRLAGIDVIDLLTFHERETGRIPIEMLHPSWLIFSDGFRRGSLRRFSSNVLNIVASFLISPSA